MANYLTTDTDLTSVANAIRTKGGTSGTLSYPSGFVSAINDIQTGGDNPIEVAGISTATYELGKFYKDTTTNKYYLGGTATIASNTWTGSAELTSVNYSSVTYGNGRFVCVGYNGASNYSTDGLTWTAMSGLSSDINNYGVTYGNGRFVCVGANGASYYSTDGLTWTAMSGLPSNYYTTGVTYGNGRFICVDLTTSYYSTDGLTWTAMSVTSSAYYKNVTYGNGRFVSVGHYGSSYYSTDGLTWTAMSGLSSSINFVSVTYGNDRFVCVGESSTSYYSLGTEINSYNEVEENGNYVSA